MSSHREDPIRAVGDEDHAHDEVEDSLGIPIGEGELADADLAQASGGGHTGGTNVVMMDGSVR